MDEINTPSRPEAITHTSLGIENVVLRGTDLSNTDLSEAQQLLSPQLAGTNLSGAVLPPHLQLDESLSRVENLSKNARAVFLSSIFACIYSWLTLATTSDMALIGNSASSALPIINTAIPIVGFYWIAPLLLLSLYFYLHLYLQRLWDALAELPAVFPDGNSLDKKIYPWLLSGLVRSHLSQLNQQRPRFSRLQVSLSILLAWWLVPITFLVFWIGYFPRHDGYGTALHTALLVVAVYAAARFYVGASDTLCRRQKPLFDWKTVYKNQRCYQQGGMVLGISLLLGGISISVIQAVPSDVKEKMGLSSINPRVWLPSAMQWLGIKIFPELAEAQFSTKPDAWDDAGVNKELIAQVKGAQLKGVQLAHVNAFGAFLVNADLRGANLAWADLSQADLRGARLDGANLQGANLLDTKISGASLRGADLRLINFEDFYSYNWRANNDFREVNLTSQDLSDTSFQFQNLTGANFQGANLENADFEGANLTSANFQGAKNKNGIFFNANLYRTNFTGAKGLTRRIFMKSKNSKIPVNFIFAIFSEKTLSKVGLPDDHNKAMREKNLQAYNLRNFTFKDADLKQFDFRGANLEGALFNKADLSRANFQRANLEGAVFSKANLNRANFQRANLEGAEFSKADLSRANFQRVNLKGAELIRINLQGTDLQEADLEKALLDTVSFIRADLRGVNFKEVKFMASKIVEANLQGANFEGALWMSVNDIYNYIKADLRDVVGLTCNQLQNQRVDLDQTNQLPEVLKTC